MKITSFGRLLVRVVEVIDVLVSVTTDSQRVGPPKKSDAFHQSLKNCKFLIAVALISEGSEVLLRFDTACHYCKQYGSIIVDEEFVWENVSSSHELLVSLKLMAQEANNAPTSTDSGSTAIPISRLEENIPVFQWYQLIAPTGESIRTAIKLELIYEKEGVRVRSSSGMHIHTHVPAIDGAAGGAGADHHRLQLHSTGTTNQRLKRSRSSNDGNSNIGDVVHGNNNDGAIANVSCYEEEVGTHDMSKHQSSYESQSPMTKEPLMTAAEYISKTYRSSSSSPTTTTTTPAAASSIKAAASSSGYEHGHNRGSFRTDVDDTPTVLPCTQGRHSSAPFRDYLSPASPKGSLSPRISDSPEGLISVQQKRDFPSPAGQSSSLNTLHAHNSVADIPATANDEDGRAIHSFSYSNSISDAAAVEEKVSDDIRNNGDVHEEGGEGSGVDANVMHVTLATSVSTCDDAAPARTTATATPTAAAVSASEHYDYDNYEADGNDDNKEGGDEAGGDDDNKEGGDEADANLTTRDDSIEEMMYIDPSAELAVGLVDYVLIIGPSLLNSSSLPKNSTSLVKFGLLAPRASRETEAGADVDDGDFLAAINAEVTASPTATTTKNFKDRIAADDDSKDRRPPTEGEEREGDREGEERERDREGEERESGWFNLHQLNCKRSKDAPKETLRIYNSATLACLLRPSDRDPHVAATATAVTAAVDASPPTSTAGVQAIATAIDDAVGVWDRFPPTNYEDSSPVPNKIEYFACPEGATYAWARERPKPSYSSFILSGGGGSDEQYGVCMTFFIENLPCLQSEVRHRIMRPSPDHRSRDRDSRHANKPWYAVNYSSDSDSSESSSDDSRSSDSDTFDPAAESKHNVAGSEGTMPRNIDIEKAAPSASAMKLWVGVTICMLTRLPHVQQLLRCLSFIYENHIETELLPWERECQYQCNSRRLSQLTTTGGEETKRDSNSSIVLRPLTLNCAELIVFLTLDSPVPIPGFLSIAVKMQPLRPEVPAPRPSVHSSSKEEGLETTIDTTARKAIDSTSNNIRSAYTKEDEIVFPSPLPNDLPVCAYSITASLLSFLEPRGLLTVLGAALAESKILFLSSNLSALPAVCDAVRTLLYPLKWTHVFLPIIPAPLLDIVQAPVPFLVGTRTDWLAYIPLDSLRDVVVVDCDTGAIVIGQEATVLQFPTAVDHWLANGLKVIYDESHSNRSSSSNSSLVYVSKASLSDEKGEEDEDDDSVGGSNVVVKDDSDTDTAIQLLIFDAMVNLLRYVPGCLFFLSASVPVFNRPLFLSECCVDSSEKSFFSVLTDTSAFHEFTNTIYSPDLVFFLTCVKRLPFTEDEEEELGDSAEGFASEKVHGFIPVSARRRSVSSTVSVEAGDKASSALELMRDMSEEPSSPFPIKAVRSVSDSRVTLSEGKSTFPSSLAPLPPSGYHRNHRSNSSNKSLISLSPMRGSDNDDDRLDYHRRTVDPDANHRGRRPPKRISFSSSSSSSSSSMMLSVIKSNTMASPLLKNIPTDPVHFNRPSPSLSPLCPSVKSDHILSTPKRGDNNRRNEDELLGSTTLGASDSPNIFPTSPFPCKTPACYDRVPTPTTSAARDPDTITGTPVYDPDIVTKTPAYDPDTVRRMLDDVSTTPTTPNSPYHYFEDNSQWSAAPGASEGASTPFRSPDFPPSPARVAEQSSSLLLTDLFVGFDDEDKGDEKDDEVAGNEVTNLDQASPIATTSGVDIGSFRLFAFAAGEASCLDPPSEVVEEEERGKERGEERGGGEEEGNEGPVKDDVAVDFLVINPPDQTNKRGLSRSHSIRQMLSTTITSSQQLFNTTATINNNNAWPMKTPTSAEYTAFEARKRKLSNVFPEWVVRRLSARSRSPGSFSGSCAISSSSSSSSRFIESGSDEVGQLLQGIIDFYSPVLLQGRQKPKRQHTEAASAVTSSLLGCADFFFGSVLTAGEDVPVLELTVGRHRLYNSSTIISDDRHVLSSRSGISLRASPLSQTSLDPLPHAAVSTQQLTDHGQCPPVLAITVSSPSIQIRNTTANLAAEKRSAQLSAKNSSPQHNFQETNYYFDSKIETRKTSFSAETIVRPDSTSHASSMGDISVLAKLQGDIDSEVVVAQSVRALSAPNRYGPDDARSVQIGTPAEPSQAVVVHRPSSSSSLSSSPSSSSSAAAAAVQSDDWSLLRNRFVDSHVAPNKRRSSPLSVVGDDDLNTGNGKIGRRSRSNSLITSNTDTAVLNMVNNTTGTVSVSSEDPRRVRRHGLSPSSSSSSSSTTFCSTTNSPQIAPAAAAATALEAEIGAKTGFDSNPDQDQEGITRASSAIVIANPDAPKCTTVSFPLSSSIDDKVSSELVAHSSDGISSSSISNTTAIAEFEAAFEGFSDDFSPSAHGLDANKVNGENPFGSSSGDRVRSVCTVNDTEDASSPSRGPRQGAVSDVMGERDNRAVTSPPPAALNDGEPADVATSTGLPAQVADIDSSPTWSNSSTADFGGWGREEIEVSTTSPSSSVLSLMQLQESRRRSPTSPTTPTTRLSSSPGTGYDEQNIPLLTTTIPPTAPSSAAAVAPPTAESSNKIIASIGYEIVAAPAIIFSMDDNDSYGQEQAGQEWTIATLSHALGIPVQEIVRRFSKAAAGSGNQRMFFPSSLDPDLGTDLGTDWGRSTGNRVGTKSSLKSRGRVKNSVFRPSGRTPLYHSPPLYDEDNYDQQRQLPEVDAPIVDFLQYAIGGGDRSASVSAAMDVMRGVYRGSLDSSHRGSIDMSGANITEREASITRNLLQKCATSLQAAESRKALVSVLQQHARVQPVRGSSRSECRGGRRRTTVFDRTTRDLRAFDTPFKRTITGQPGQSQSEKASSTIHHHDSHDLMRNHSPAPRRLSLSQASPLSGSPPASQVSPRKSSHARLCLEGDDNTQATSEEQEALQVHHDKKRRSFRGTQFPIDSLEESLAAEGEGEDGILIADGPQRMFPVHTSTFESLSRLFALVIEVCVRERDYLTAFELLQVGGLYFHVRRGKKRSSSSINSETDCSSDNGEVEFLSGRIRHHPVYQSAQLWREVMRSRLPLPTGSLDTSRSTARHLYQASEENDHYHYSCDEVCFEAHSLLYIMHGLGVNIERVKMFLQHLTSDYGMGYEDYLGLETFSERLWTTQVPGGHHNDDYDTSGVGGGNEVYDAFTGELLGPPTTDMFSRTFNMSAATINGGNADNDNDNNYDGGGDGDGDSSLLHGINVKSRRPFGLANLSITDDDVDVKGDHSFIGSGIKLRQIHPRQQSKDVEIEYFDLTAIPFLGSNNGGSRSSTMGDAESSSSIKSFGGFRPLRNHSDGKSSDEQQRGSNGKGRSGGGMFSRITQFQSIFGKRRSSEHVSAATTATTTTAVAVAAATPADVALNNSNTNGITADTAYGVTATTPSALASYAHQTATTTAITATSINTNSGISSSKINTYNKKDLVIIIGDMSSSSVSEAKEQTMDTEPSLAPATATASSFASSPSSSNLHPPVPVPVPVSAHVTQKASTPRSGARALVDALGDAATRITATVSSYAIGSSTGGGLSSRRPSGSSSLIVLDDTQLNEGLRRKLLPRFDHVNPLPKGLYDHTSRFDHVNPLPKGLYDHTSSAMAEGDTASSTSRIRSYPRDVTSNRFTRIDLEGSERDKAVSIATSSKWLLTGLEDGSINANCLTSGKRVANLNHSLRPGTGTGGTGASTVSSYTSSVLPNGVASVGRGHSSSFGLKLSRGLSSALPPIAPVVNKGMHSTSASSSSSSVSSSYNYHGVSHLQALPGDTGCFVSACSTGIVKVWLMPSSPSSTRADTVRLRSLTTNKVHSSEVTCLTAECTGAEWIEVAEDDLPAAANENTSSSSSSSSEAPTSTAQREADACEEEERKEREKEKRSSELECSSVRWLVASGDASGSVVISSGQGGNNTATATVSGGSSSAPAGAAASRTGSTSSSNALNLTTGHPGNGNRHQQSPSSHSSTTGVEIAAAGGINCLAFIPKSGRKDKSTASMSSLQRSSQRDSSSDYVQLGIGTTYGVVAVLDVATAQVAFRVTGHCACVTGLAALRNQQLLTCSLDRSVKLWDLRSSQVALAGGYQNHSTPSLPSPSRLTSIYSLNDTPFKGFIGVGIGSGNSSPGSGSKSGPGFGSAASGVGLGLGSIGAGGGCLLGSGLSGRYCRSTSGPATAALAVGDADNNLVLAASADGVISIWDIRSDLTRPYAVLEGHTNRISSITWNESYGLITASHDGTVRIWDCLQGRCKQILRVYDDTGVSALSLSSSLAPLPPHHGSNYSNHNNEGGLDCHNLVCMSLLGSVKAFTTGATRGT